MSRQGERLQQENSVDAGVDAGTGAHYQGRGTARLLTDPGWKLSGMQQRETPPHCW